MAAGACASPRGVAAGAGAYDTAAGVEECGAAEGAPDCPIRSWVIWRARARAVSCLMADGFATTEGSVAGAALMAVMGSFMQWPCKQAVESRAVVRGPAVQAPAAGNWQCGT